MTDCHCAHPTGGKARTKKKRNKKRGRKFFKGSKSLSRKGRLDFTTKKTSKMYNRDGHRQQFSADGLRDHPFGAILRALDKPKQLSSKRKRKGRRRKSKVNEVEIFSRLGGVDSFKRKKKGKKNKSKKKNKAKITGLSIAKCFSF